MLFRKACISRLNLVTAESVQITTHEVARRKRNYQRCHSSSPLSSRIGTCRVLAAHISHRNEYTAAGADYQLRARQLQRLGQGGACSSPRSRDFLNNKSRVRYLPRYVTKSPQKSPEQRCYRTARKRSRPASVEVGQIARINASPR